MPGAIPACVCAQTRASAPPRLSWSSKESPMRFIQVAALCAAGSLLVLSTAMAAGRSSQSEAQATYNSDRAACMRGNTGQDRETCLKEAGAALGEARRGNLNDG